MILTPYSRRLRFFGGISVLALVATYIHIQPTWRVRTYSYAHDLGATVSNYFAASDVYNNTLYQQGTEGVVTQYHNFSDPCTGFPNTDGVLLVMKTGATEAFDKVPTHLLTTLQCMSDFLIFSDMEQQIGKYHIYDVLAEVEESAKAHNDDFDLYRAQKECPVSQKSCVDARDGESKAWKLDKYKFLPMMEQTWRMRPGRDWYIFAEADTYVFWANMVYWLRTQSQLNPKERIYLGSRSFIGGMPFAHGGSGYVMSGSLLRHLIEHHPGVVKQYSVKGANECCGDLMLAQALEQYEEVKIRQTWPMFNGEKPSTLPFGPGHWCEPILTMHHVNAEEISSVWQFEQTRKTDRTLLIKDLYHGLIAPKMQVQRHDWDNLSDDVCYISSDADAQARAGDHEKGRQKKGHEMTQVEKDAWKSPKHCARVCEEEDVPDEDEWELKQKVVPRNPEEVENAANASDTEKAEDSDASDEAMREQWKTMLNEHKKSRTCFQYRWHDEVCCTARSFKLGAPKSKPDEDKQKEQWVSGWDLKGINDWIDAMGECKEIAWKTPEKP
ncbi:hypothetical protein BKA67DRAFT_659440 [Truncatella angustata]|uniref:Glycosyltransferase family 31 protein n=1 Tax=Truncatella angustata TaxID=152316 RepID=A0A9P8UIC4_9PEZI|nr:uncharacterized protein BKA67DRAFT_659440 [Truncatella angustata]KAH6652765.1 hypothetical protein BKA67DRAFT_659440 [Truncatella angustata]